MIMENVIKLLNKYHKVLVYNINTVQEIQSKTNFKVTPYYEVNGVRRELVGYLIQR